jgi:hypothetical protein
MNWNRISMLSLLVFAVGLMVGPAVAGAQQAILYELTENMSITPEGTVAHRLATAALQGWAKVGTPLCPAEVLITNPRAQTCTVTAVGSDDVSVVTGTGTVSGTYAVVVQGDNPVDAPEYVVQTGTFSGTMDLSPAVLGLAPLGYISNGTFTIDGYPGYTIPFTGTFRLPFALTQKGEKRKARLNDHSYYLSDAFEPFRVRPRETSLGWPTVRFEVTFE